MKDQLHFQENNLESTEWGECLSSVELWWGYSPGEVFSSVSPGMTYLQENTSQYELRAKIQVLKIW